MLRRSIDNLELQKRNLRLFIVTLISLLVFFTVSYAGRQIERLQVQAEADRWSQRIDEARAQQGELAEQLAYVKSEAYVDQVAREQLGMVQPGDSVVILIPEEPAEEAEVAALSEHSDLLAGALPASAGNEVTLQNEPASTAMNELSKPWWERVVQFFSLSTTD